MKTILVCYLLLHPYQGEGYNTTVIRQNQRSPQACIAASAEANNRFRKQQCSCHKPRNHPAALDLARHLKEKQ